MFANLLIRFFLWLSRKTPPRVITGRSRVDVTCIGRHDYKVGEQITFAGSAHILTEVIAENDRVSGAFTPWRKFLGLES